MSYIPELMAIAIADAMGAGGTSFDEIVGGNEIRGYRRLPHTPWGALSGGDPAAASALITLYDFIIDAILMLDLFCLSERLSA